MERNTPIEMLHVREDRLCFLALDFYIIIMATIEESFLMFKFYCTDISGTSHIFRGKQLVKGFAELGLKFSHQIDQFAVVEPIILNIRNVALKFPIFLNVKTIKQRARPPNYLIKLKQLVKPCQFLHTHRDTKAVVFLKDAQEYIHTGRSVPVRWGHGDACRNVYMFLLIRRAGSGFTPK